VTLTEDKNSFGPGFNKIGGGWCVTCLETLSTLAAYRLFRRYAMERTLHYIKVWFWERDDPFVPWDIRSGAWMIDTDSWVIALASPSSELCLHMI
jgi:hypothetical protein